MKDIFLIYYILYIQIYFWIISTCSGRQDDINEEKKVEKGFSTHVLGSVIYQAKRDNALLLTSGVIELEQLKSNYVNSRDAPNTHQKLKTLHYLVGKVNVKEWLYHRKPTISMDRALIFCRLCPRSYTD